MDIRDLYSNSNKKSTRCFHKFSDERSGLHTYSFDVATAIMRAHVPRFLFVTSHNIASCLLCRFGNIWGPGSPIFISFQDEREL